MCMDEAMMERGCGGGLMMFTGGVRCVCARACVCVGVRLVNYL